MANAAIAKVAHLDVDGFIFDARLVTYIAYLLCGAMVFVICETAGAPPLHACLAAMMMLGHPDFVGQNASPRPDMLYLLAMLMSLYCAVKWENLRLARIWAGRIFCRNCVSRETARACGCRVDFRRPGVTETIQKSGCSYHKHD